MKQVEKKKVIIIAVDFDGTLCVDKYPAIGAADDELIKALKAVQERGHILILNTCRCGKYLQDAVLWCQERGLIFEGVNENHNSTILRYDGNEARKITADVHIDDKDICFNRLIVLNQLKKIIQGEY